jgi:phosphoglycerate dehydrogenase-like enzyme
MSIPFFIMMMMTSFFLTAVLLVSIGQHGPNHLKSASWKRNLFSRATRMAMITATPNEEITKTKVAVVGSGAVGGYYGSRLWEAGYNTFFHMRGEHLETSRVKGLLVTVSLS